MDGYVVLKAEEKPAPALVEEEEKQVAELESKHAALKAAKAKAHSARVKLSVLSKLKQDTDEKADPTTSLAAALAAAKFKQGAATKVVQKTDAQAKKAASLKSLVNASKAKISALSAISA